MTKRRSQYLYQLVGIIKEIKINKLKNRECFNLTVELSNYPEISIIQAFRDKLKPPVWADLVAKQFMDQRYLFKCQNYFGNYHLVDWQILLNQK